MKLPQPVQGIKLLEQFVGGEDMRPVPIDDGIKELCYSIIANGLLQPPSAIDFGDHVEPFIGFRRLAALRWGLGEHLDVPNPIPVMLYPATTTKLQMKIAQLTENLARLDASDVQIYQTVTELAAAGLSREELAQALARSKPSICRYFAPDKGLETTKLFRIL